MSYERERFPAHQSQESLSEVWIVEELIEEAHSQSLIKSGVWVLKVLIDERFQLLLQPFHEIGLLGANTQHFL